MNFAPGRASFRRLWQVWLGLFGVAMLAPSASEAAGEKNAPAALVAELYARPESASPFFQTKSRRLVDRYFAKPLADLIWKDANDSKGEVGAIDGSPIYDAQDYEPKALEIRPANISGEKATVEVTFENFGKRKRIVYRLVLAGAAEWKISDIEWAPDRTLWGVLQASYSKP